MPAVSSLVEDFSGGSIDTSKFETSSTPPWIFGTRAGTYSQSAGLGHFEPGSTSGNFVGIASVLDTLNFENSGAGDSCWIKLAAYEVSQNSDFYFGFTERDTGAGANFRIYVTRNFDAPQIGFAFSNFGDNTASTLRPLDAEDDVYLRLRVPSGGGNLIAETAPEASPGVAGTYTMLHQLSGSSGVLFDMSNMKLHIGVDNWNGQSGLLYSVDNLNYEDSGGPGPIDATASLTEANDTLAASAASALNASAATLVAADTLASVAGARIALAGALTEAPDTSAATLASALAASATVTIGADTVSSTTTNRVTASGALTEAADTLVATAEEVAQVQITAALLEAADTVSGTAVNAIVATAGLTESPDTVTGTVSLSLAASGTLVEAADNLVGVVSNALTALGSLLEASDTLVADAVGPGGITASLFVTEENDTLVSVSASGISLSAAIGEQADSVVSTALLSSLLNAALTEQSDSAAAVVQLAVVCSASMQEAANTLASTIRQLGPDLPVAVVVRGDPNSRVILDLGLLAIRADGSVTIIL